MYFELSNLYQWHIGIYVREVYTTVGNSDLSEDVILSFGFLLFSINFLISK